MASVSAFDARVGRSEGEQLGDEITEYRRAEKLRDVELANALDPKRTQEIWTKLILHEAGIESADSERP